MSLKIARLLSNSDEENPITLYSLFCPSYKKGDGEIGFRIDDIGNTSISGINNLKEFFEATKNMGFAVNEPLAFFFDLAVERYEDLVSKDLLGDILINVNNFKRHLPANFKFIRLSDIRELSDKIGFRGLSSSQIPIPQSAFDKIVERGRAFYELFGWSDAQIVKRSKIIACSEAYVGGYLRRNYPTGIMLYTPTMLERAEVYSGMDYINDPLPIIFPSKGL